MNLPNSKTAARPSLNWHCRGRRGAFTLLELLISLVIVSGLTLTLFADLRIGFKARSTGDPAVEPARAAEEAMNFLRIDFESVLSPNVNAATNTGIFQQNFEAPGTYQAESYQSDDLVDFYTTADSLDHVDANGEIKMVGLALETVGNEQVLVRRVMRNLTAQNPPDVDREILCRGVTGFQLEFFDGTQWQPSWDSTLVQDANGNPALPLAVRVTMDLQRPLPNGQVQSFRFVRTFQLVCSTLVPGSSSSSTGGSGL